MRINLSVLAYVHNISSEMEYPYSVYSCKIFIFENDYRESKSIKINHKMKILTVALMLLFNYLDTLPTLYYSFVCFLLLQFS